MPAPLRDMPQEGIELIKSFEGIPDGDPSTTGLDPYLDPLDIWTIGWGHAVVSNGAMVRGKGNRALAFSLFPGGISVAQAEALLRGDLVSRAADMLRLVKVELDDGQFGALMSFVFNCGIGNFGASTLLKKLNAGDSSGAADQFLVWNKGRKDGQLVELPGLTRRRKAERALFLGQDWRAVASTATRSRGAAAITPSREVPVAPTPAEAKAAKAFSAPKKKAAAAKKAAAKKAPAKKKAAARR
jgi:GH24 family phage-related lysozyme (muramidase)